MKLRTFTQSAAKHATCTSHGMTDDQIIETMQCQLCGSCLALGTVQETGGTSWDSFRVWQCHNGKERYDSCLGLCREYIRIYRIYVYTPYIRVYWKTCPYIAVYTLYAFNAYIRTLQTLE